MTIELITEGRTRTLKLPVSLLRVQDDSIDLEVPGATEPAWRVSLVRLPDRGGAWLGSAGTASDALLTELAIRLGASHPPIRMREKRVLSAEFARPDALDRGRLEFHQGAVSLTLEFELNAKDGWLALTERDGRSLATLIEICSADFVDAARVRLVRHFEAGETALALSTAKDALEADPGDACSWLYLARTELELVGEPVRAEPSFSKAITLLDQDAGGLDRERLLRLALGGRAACRGRTGALAAAIDDLSRLLGFRTAKLYRFRVLLDRGRYRHQLGETTAALEDLTAAIALEVAPVSDAYLARAEVWRSLGRTEDADADALEAQAHAEEGKIKSVSDFFES